MNLKIEACRQCPTKCQLEKRSNQIIAFSQTLEATLDLTRQRVSQMTQEARRLSCPTIEMQRVLRITREIVDPARLNRLGISPYPSAKGEIRPDLDPPKPQSYRFRPRS